jgi:putative ABC transport system permease protein
MSEYHHMNSLLQDLRYALRQLRRSPGFTAVAVATLALGIGANTAIFSVVNGVLLRPLAYREPGRLYLIREIVPQMAKFYPLLPANIPNFRIWQEECHSFEGIALAEPADANVAGTGETERIHGVRSSANLFDVLGAYPTLGRSFLPQEDEPGRGRVVVLTDQFWRNHFYADPRVVGRQIGLDGVPYTVVGVLPASFHFAAQRGFLGDFGAKLDFFEPLNGPKPYEQGLIGEFDFTAIGRLRSGVSADEAEAELNVVQARIAQKANEGVDLKAAVFPLESEIVGPARRGLMLLLGAVGAVLLIVSFNLANLLLARAPGRARERAICSAVGASRWQLFRRALVESLLLGALGGGLGVGAGALGLTWFLRLAPRDLPRLDEVHMDVRVLAFAVLLSLLVGVLVGVLPAWRAAGSDPLDALKSGSAGTGEDRRARRLRQVLIGLEVGLSTLLLIVAGLLTSSLVRLLRADAGFRTEKVLTADVDLPPQTYSDPATRLHFYETLLERLRAVPGVSSAAWVSILPLEGQGSVTGIDVPPSKPGSPPPANYRPVSPGYFSTVGIPLLRGRIFSESDRGHKVVVVSESIAKRFWPGQDPIGRTCLTYWGPEEANEVIGVVGDIHTVSLDTPPVMMVYVPDWFGPLHLASPMSAGIAVRASIDERGVASAVRQAIHATDPEVPITALRPMAELVAESVGPRRFHMLLLQSFALCALFLAALGIYGVIAYSVEQRRRELGIRAALGAQFSDLRRMVLRQGMTPLLAGLAAGMLASMLIGRLIRSLLFGVGTLDPVTFLTVVFLVGVVGTVACLLPARRAARVDPVSALRYE